MSVRTPSQLIAAANGQVCSSEGWVLRRVGPDLLEYDDGRASCLINIGSGTRQAVRPIYASESASDLFPHLREHVREALPYLKGSYVVV
ncbi:MAG: hypothetical protein J0L57_01910 [Burkholderiales bacterium]|nr:hypothetical protein [Burkholderiales bacterium]